ncbi:BTB POZ fold domain containing [Cordyceps militaris]|uniref:BTB POZ fold domain containing n=1 Tax=Cordyceps militaris TaxID=73501 RepID=A0A2H4SBX4_CORMI|nr:BTB POZ fold domain containing [Cordyceps militaris]
MNAAFFVPSSHHHHRPSRAHLHNRSNNAEPDAANTLDNIPPTPTNMTEPVPEQDTWTSRLSVSDSRPSANGPPFFREATAAAGSNVAAEVASINAAPTPVLDSRVVLRVGEKQFFTTRATLAESHLLTAVLSTDATHDGEYFLDADPDMFSEVLRFLRMRRFPLFYNPSSGYDTAKYLELLVAAQFYQIPTLEMWLTEKRYLGAMNIKSEYKRFRLFGTDQISRMHELCWDREEQGRILSISETKGKAHACPQKLWRHDGDQTKCMKARCFQQRSSAVPGPAMMRLVDLTVLVTRSDIREGVLSAGSYPDGPPPYEGGEDG